MLSPPAPALRPAVMPAGVAAECPHPQPVLPLCWGQLSESSHRVSQEAILLCVPREMSQQGYSPFEHQSPQGSTV